MYPSNLLILLIFVTVSFNDAEGDDSMRWKLYRELKANYRSTIKEMAWMTTEVNTNINRLANETFANLDHRVSGKLKEKFADYGTDWIDALMRSVGLFFSEDRSTPCFRPFEYILNDIYAEVNRTTREIEPILKSMDDCGKDLELCKFVPNFLNFREKMNDLVNRWSQYKEHDFVEEWTNIKKCHNELSSDIESKLLNSTIRRSEVIPNYTSFLQKLSLWPMTLFTITGKNTHWFSLRGGRTWERRTDIDKSGVEEFLKIAQKSISSHLEGYLTPHINEIVNSSVKRIQTEINMLLDVQTDLPSELPCYNRGLGILLNELDTYYQTRMKGICFAQTLDSQEKFKNIVECDFKEMKESVSGIRFCWDAPEVCQEVILKLKQISIFTHVWLFHDLPVMLRNAYDCYSTTFHVIYRNFKNEFGNLMNCTDMHLTQGLLRSFPTYPETYEIPMKLEICRNQTETHSGNSTVYHYL